MSMRWPTLISQTLVTTRPFDEIMILVAWAAGIAASLILVPTALGVAGGGLAVLMIAIAVVDARRFIIPNELTAAALALGFLHAAIQGPLVEALASAALPWRLSSWVCGFCIGAFADVTALA